MSSKHPFLKKRAYLLTYLVSAIWHGFYPGYYLAAIHANIDMACEKILFTRFLKRDGIPLLAQGIISHTFISYACIPFVILGFWDSLQAWYNMYFFGHIVYIAIIIALKLSPKYETGKKAEEKVKIK